MIIRLAARSALTIAAILLAAGLLWGLGLEHAVRRAPADAPWMRHDGWLALREAVELLPPADRDRLFERLAADPALDVRLLPPGSPPPPGPPPVAGVHLPLTDGSGVLSVGPMRPPELPGAVRWGGLVLLVLTILITALALALPLGRQLQRLQRAIEALAEARFDVRVAGGTGSIGGLERVLDGAAARLEDLFRERQELIQTVSHELTTPLARARLILASMRRSAPDPADGGIHGLAGGPDALAQLDREIDELTALADELAAWVDADAAPHPTEPVDVAAAARDLAELAAARSDDRIAVRVIAPPDGAAAAILSPRHLDRALDNLLRNACRFARAQVELRVDVEAGAVRVTVGDDGPGIPEADRQRVLQPFVRLDEGGMGLGLSIARRIAERRGGRLDVGASPLGGAELRLTLPVAG